MPELILPAGAGPTNEEIKEKAIKKLEEILEDLQLRMAKQLTDDQVSPTAMQQLTANFGFFVSIHECLKHNIRGGDHGSVVSD